ncbi:MAG: SDR family oxidoreductase [Propionibacteriaceae bacterium]|jgi:NADP-dependent 3-hydroxy acid dehydrogenase YdfG|nr:SDR family oxidoreductase [Propionibacteriaceae bacterium]
MPPTKARVTWITGAGSGMGRAAAAAAAPGRRIALSGRRRTALEQTADLVRAAGGEALVVPLDVACADAIAAGRDQITAAWGPITDLVLAAGLNHPHRAWQDQAMADFEAIIATNLTGVARVIDAALPSLRAAGDAVIVIISSYAGWRLSSSPGVAYSASKLGLAALAATLNGQEARHGVRTTLLCPGDVDTDFLQMRPAIPDAAARSRMLTADDIGRAVRFVLDCPPHMVVDELVVSPTSQHC